MMLVAMATFLLVALVLPAARMRVRFGRWGFAFLGEQELLARATGAVFTMLAGGLIVFAALYAWLGPRRLSIWDAPLAMRVVGGVMMVLGCAVVVWAQREMGASWRIGIDQAKTALVTRGIYRFVRNPIYTGCMLATAGMAVAVPSPWDIALVASFAWVIDLQVRLEERHLMRMHGPEFEAYAKTAGRFLPRVGALTAERSSRNA
jgi:protein-S-isoprenylcysteine O-methyltransferase Ste14